MSMQIKLESYEFIQSLPKGECDYCDLRFYKPFWIFPPHTASEKCESGGVNHCHCGICF